MRTKWNDHFIHIVDTYHLGREVFWLEGCMAVLLVQEVVDREEFGAAELQIPSQILFFSTIVTFEGAN
jgi:hypothetical protein